MKLRKCKICEIEFYGIKYCSDTCRKLGAKIVWRRKFQHNKARYYGYIKKSREKYKDVRLAYARNWKMKNKDRNRAYNISYIKKRCKNDPSFRLALVLRARIRDAIKDCKDKTKLTKELLGCTIDEAKQWIESQLKEGMSWDNYGIYGWHIDHIIPCAAFDLTKLEEQKKCFHYSNLQPLWAKDNLTKGARI